MANNNDEEVVIGYSADTTEYEKGIEGMKNTEQDFFESTTKGAEKMSEERLKAEAKYYEAIGKLRKTESKNDQNNSKDKKSLTEVIRGLVRNYFTWSAAIRVVERTAQNYLKVITDTEAGVRKLNSILEVSDEQLYKYGDTLRDVAIENGREFTDVLEGTYQALSTGIPEDNLISFMQTATKFANAGYTTVEKGVDAVTTVMNAYNIAVEDADQVMDTFIKGQQQGKFTIDSLSGSLSRIIPTAAGANIAFEDILGSLVQLTLDGNTAQQSATQLARMINELTDESSMLSMVVKDQTGQSFQELMLNGESLGTVMKAISDGMKDAEMSANQLTKSSVSQQAILTLTKNSGDGLVETLKELTDGAGSMDRANKNAMKDLNNVITSAKGEFTKLFWNQEVKKAITNVVTFLRNEMKKLSSYDEMENVIKAESFVDRALFRKEMYEMAAIYGDEAGVRYGEYLVKGLTKAGAKNKALDDLGFFPKTQSQIEQDEQNSLVEAQTRGVSTVEEDVDRQRQLKDREDQRAHNKTMEEIASRYHDLIYNNDKITGEQAEALKNSQREEELRELISFNEKRKNLGEDYSNYVTELDEILLQAKIKKNDRNKAEELEDKAHRLNLLAIAEKYNELERTTDGINEEGKQIFRDAKNLEELEAMAEFYKDKERYEVEYQEVLQEINDLELQKIIDHNEKKYEEEARSQKRLADLDEENRKKKKAAEELAQKNEKMLWDQGGKLFSDYANLLLTENDNIIASILEITGQKMVSTGIETIWQGIAGESMAAMYAANPLMAAFAPGLFATSASTIATGTAMVGAGVALGAAGSSMSSGSSSSGSSDAEVQSPEEVVEDNESVVEDVVVIEGAEVITDLIVEHIGNKYNVDIIATHRR